LPDEFKPEKFKHNRAESIAPQYIRIPIQPGQIKGRKKQDLTPMSPPAPLCARLTLLQLQ
jgi:hypothetical protein